MRRSASGNWTRSTCAEAKQREEEEGREVMESAAPLGVRWRETVEEDRV